MKTIDSDTRELLKTWIIRFGGGLLVPVEDGGSGVISTTIDRLNSRKLRKVGVSFEIWSAMLRGELFPASGTTAPADLAVLGILPSGSPALDVDVLVWSEEFSRIPGGAREVPDVSIAFRVEYLVIGPRS